MRSRDELSVVGAPKHRENPDATAWRFPRVSLQVLPLAAAFVLVVSVAVSSAARDDTVLGAARLARPAPRAMASPARLRCQPTGASSPSPRTPPTCIPTTATAPRTSSCATCRRTRPCWSAAPRARPAPRANGYSIFGVDLGRRALRRLRFGRDEPGSRRRRRHPGRVRARPAGGHDRRWSAAPRRGRRQGQRLLLARRRSRPTGASSPSSRAPPTCSRRHRRRPRTSSCATGRRARPAGEPAVRRGRRQGQRRLRVAVDLGRRALRRLRLGRHEPGSRRHRRAPWTSSCATSRRARPCG